MNKLLIAFLIAFLTIAGCTKSGSENSGTDAGESELKDGAAFRTDCGTVYNGENVNPVSSSSGEAATLVRVIDSNTVVINIESGETALKLHGLGKVASNREAAAVKLLGSLGSRNLRLFRAGSECVVDTSAGPRGLVGHLFTENGKHFGEALVSSGLEPVIENGACNEELVTGCYQALKESSSLPSAGSIRDFLWKPESDGGFSPGNLVVLTDACNVDVLVNGEKLVDYGPSNGRCTTARSQSRSGCQYGANITVEIVDSLSGYPYLFPDGQPYYIVPNGCNRSEFVL
ncbi:MAG: hypothetical protein KDD42_06405 [Bdellovibrionales bacterium]|nr:hypothetical protein [Bdellovibrionales bacterium]